MPAVERGEWESTRWEVKQRRTIPLRILLSKTAFHNPPLLVLEPLRPTHIRRGRRTIRRARRIRIRPGPRAGRSLRDAQASMWIAVIHGGRIERGGARWWIVAAR